MKKIVYVIADTVILIMLSVILSVTASAKENKKSTAYKITTSVPATATFDYDDDDYRMWFKFTAPASDYYEFEVIKGNEDFEFITYDSNGHVVSYYGEYDSFNEKVYDIINCKKGETYYLCLDYDGYKTVTVSVSAKKHTHKYVVTDYEKATPSSSGYIEKECAGCEKYILTKYYAVNGIKLSETSYLYDGKTKKPIITVADSKGNALKLNTDYKLSGTKSAKSIGKYSVKITLMGNYKGSKILNYTIKPFAPKNVKCTGVTDKSVTLKWDKVSGASSYNVYLYEYGYYYKVKNVTANTAKITKLENCTGYKFKITAVKKTDSGVISSDKSVACSTFTRPSVPDFDVYSFVEGKAEIEIWNENNAKNTFKIYMATSKNGTYKLVKTIKNVDRYEDVTSYIAGLKSGKKYYFKMKASYTKNSITKYSNWSKIIDVEIS